MMWQRMVALALRQRQFSGGICHSGTAALSNPCDLHSKPSFEPTQGSAEHTVVQHRAKAGC